MIVQISHTVALPEIHFTTRRISSAETYFAFLTFWALIFAHRAFAARIMFARPAADRVLLARLPFALIVCVGDTAIFSLPFSAAIAP